MLIIKHALITIKTYGLAKIIPDLLIIAIFAIILL